MSYTIYTFRTWIQFTVVCNDDTTAAFHIYQCIMHECIYFHIMMHFSTINILLNLSTSFWKSVTNAERGLHSDVAGNNLTGEIPATIGNCTSLQVL